MPPKASILVVCFNHLAHTRACLERVRDVTPAGLYELVVVDNASTDGTGDWLAAFRGSLPEGAMQVISSPENLGFVDGNNRAAEVAGGEYLVFLNNDTLPAPGWLEALVDTAERDATAGVVCARLLNTDGTLQEAGGILFSDATGCNYGRGGDPEAPEYAYVREVDYGSGACLLARASLFRKLGGFDRRFAPAYYEDTDLCFAARREGLRVVYQPAARVVHHEGVTAGRDTESGFKKFQAVNRPKFLEKWTAELRLQPVVTRDPRETARAAHRISGRQVLMFHEIPPLFDRASGFQRIHNMVRLLAERGHHVTVACLHSGEHEGIDLAPYVERLRATGVMVYPLDRPLQGSPPRVDPSAAMGALLAGRDYDVALLPFYESALRLIPRLIQESPRTRIVIDSVDLDFLRHARRARQEDLPETWRPFRQMQARELAAYRCANTVLTVTEDDRLELLRHLPDRDVRVVPDVYHVDEHEPGFEARRDLVFLAGFRHLPNVDAVAWFHAEVWPRVRELLPGVRWRIVGDRPPESVRRLHGGDIEVTGYVPDLAPYLSGARVSIAPLRYGAGLKGKIAMALGCGLPCVTTPVGAEGMHLVDGRNARIASDPEGFARAIAELYDSKEAWEALSRAGRELVREAHGDERIASLLGPALGLGPDGPREERDLGDPVHLADAMSRGHELLESNSPEAASEIFARVLGAHPHLPGAVSGLALSLAAMRDFGAAGELMRRELLETPRPAVLLVACGRVLEAAGRVQDAVGQYQQAINLEPANTWAVSEATRLAETHGNLPVAASGYARLCELMPGELAPALRRADLLARMGDYAGARDATAEALRRARAQSRMDLVEGLEEALRARPAPRPGKAEACAA
ncbi:MAG: glycosyltransferase [Candidatus Eisenbacteria bacterium]|nr:glycosyltransferase [Candidatus Eisenbacteria bacterium]